MKSSSGARNIMKRGRRRRKPGTLRGGAGIKKMNTRGTVEIRGAAGDKQKRSNNNKERNRNEVGEKQHKHREVVADKKERNRGVLAGKGMEKDE